MGSSIRGDKAHVRVLVNGQAISMFEITGVDVAEDTQATESYYAGQKQPETDAFMMGFSGSIQSEVKNEVIDQLIQDIRDARNSGAALPQVSMIIYEEYPDGALGGAAGITFLYTDVQFMFASRRSGGATEKVVKVISFKANDKKIVP